MLGYLIVPWLLLLTGCITVNPPPTTPPSAPDVGDPSSAATSPSGPTSDSSSAGTSQEPTATADLVRATVRIRGYDAEGRPSCSGSGSILDASGTILTNLHVIEAGGGCHNDTIGVALTESADKPAEVAYIAHAYAVDADLDLAILKIETDRDGDPVPKDFRHVELGDSDKVQIGDRLRILGYPGIGGDTITYTEGQVSGFTPSPDIQGRAWIKTQATIAGGNSGGMATDASGRLVGVPTRAGGGDPDDPTTDCRVVQDTDSDGDTDGDDRCVPIGGFLNSLRPVSLARDLIARAATAEALPNDDLRSSEVSSPAASVTDIRFASDATDPKTPTDAAVYLPSGADQVCAFFDYAGIKEETPVDLIWKHDGDVDNTTSLYGFEWNLDDSGSSIYCAGSADSQPAREGLWELSLYLNGGRSPAKTRSVFVGDSHRLANVTFRNDAETTICELLVAPQLATQWQNNRLPEDQLAPGASVSFELAAGTYDAQARDCDRQKVVEIGPFDVAESTTVSLAR